MSYTPKNIYVYLQSFAGAVAGLLGQSNQLNNVEGAYTDTELIAAAWAEAVDTKWNTTANPDEFEYSEMLAWSTSHFEVVEPSAQSVATLPSTYFNDALAMLRVISDGEAVLSDAGITPPAIFGVGNYAGITNEATTNGQGSGGPTIVALIQLVAQKSGIFDYAVSAQQAAAAATEVVTWELTTQTGAPGSFTFSSGGAANGIVGSGTGTVSNCIKATGAAGTGITIITGGGGELSQAQKVETIGTAAVGSSFAASGILQNSITNATVTDTPSQVPFTIDNHVILILKITNSATNRVVNKICMKLEERAAA